MDGFLLFVLLVVLLIRWWVLSQRYAAMEGRINALVSRDPVDAGSVARLVRRVYQLELAVAGLKDERSQRSSEPPVVEPKPDLEPVAVSAPTAPSPVIAPDREPPVEPIEIPTPAPQDVPAPAFTIVPRAERVEFGPATGQVHPSRSSEEWEALVGGNWLNKLGILILVIAIALFLGYSFTELGPGGRSAIGLAVSMTMLAAGVVLERRAAYATFGRGLLGGGWAGLYFTTYAMQAVDAAKIIHNPLVGGILLLAVATGMVAHSLRYRVQTVTGLAYFVAFATLAITPVTVLSVIALAPLAASLLVVAYRFSWSEMVLFGLVATYATCASRGDNGAPLWSAQAVFASYWLLFEAYDILRAYRRSVLPAELPVLALNAIGFGALSYAKWSAAAPAEIYKLAAGMATAYLASTIVRAVLRPPSSFVVEDTTMDRILAGAYEGPVTLAAVFSAAAAALKLHGQTVNAVLLAEGELLFLAGLFFRQNYPRRLAGAVFGCLGFKLVSTDIPAGGIVTADNLVLNDWPPTTVLAGLHIWTPTAIFAAALFYLNRALRKAGRTYGYAASALVALIIGYEVSMRHLGVTWLGLGALLFVFGWTFRLFDFRVQGYLAGVLALGAMWLHQTQISMGMALPWGHSWIPLAAAVVVGYGAALCALHSAANRLTNRERQVLEATASTVAMVASVALLWRTVPAVYLGPAWMALGILALELGLRRWPPDLRAHSYLAGALGALQVLCFTVLPVHTIDRTDERVAIAWAALLAYAFAARMFAAGPDEAPRHESRRAVDIASACGSLFVMIELWALMSPMAVAPAWALFALALMEIGYRTDLPSLRFEGHLAGAAGFGRLLFANLEPGGSFMGVSHRLLSMAAVAASHYYQWWRQDGWQERLREWERPLKRPYLYTAAALLSLLLYLELRAPWIEAGWAILTLLLVMLGRRWNMEDLRLQSYALAALAFWRALDLELEWPEVFTSATQRIVAGGLVTSSLFAAQLFHDRAHRARRFFSLLATILATALLYHEVTASMLTVAWGMEGAVLLAAGFPLRDRTMRLSGLALFLISIGKLFFYDLRQLETLYRILSFFVLGVILLSVSWVYTRFRDRIRRYL